MQILFNKMERFLGRSVFSPKTTGKRRKKAKLLTEINRSVKKINRFNHLSLFG